MDLSQQKSQFSLAYVHAVASVAGFALYDFRVDDDSVDCGIGQRGGNGTIRSPRLELQLKCTSQELMHQDGIHFPLERKNYDDLRGNDFMVPRALVVMMVPSDISSWLESTPEQLVIRRCAWWVSLAGAEERPGIENPTVILPVTQSLTPEALRGLLERAGRGEPL